MKVLVLSANREHFPEPVFPLGAAFLASRLIAEGAETSIFDAGTYPFPLINLRREISHYRPAVVALSLRNADNAAFPCTVTYGQWYRRIVAAVRSASSAPVVLGGSAFSIFPSEFLDFLGADGGHAGDGEAAVPSLLRPRREEGGFSRGRLENIEETAIRPECLDLFPRRRRYRTIGVQTARGCPNRCVYCTYPALEGRRVRARLPEQVVEEIALFRKTWGIREFFIVDSSFNASEGHMAAVLEELVQRNLDIRFTCYLQPKIEDAGLIPLLAAAGCVAVEFGTDSGSPEMLDALGKDFMPEDIVKSSERCRLAGIEFCHSLIFGGPGERGSTIDETVRVMERTAPRAVVAMTGIRIYPGTGLEAKAVREGILEEGGPLLEPVFSFGGSDPDTLLRLLFERAGGRGNWFFPGRRNWSLSPGFRLVRFFHRRGPLWFRLRQGAGATPSSAGGVDNRLPGEYQKRISIRGGQ